MPSTDRAEIRWQEIVSRGAAVTLMYNFTSVADALKELVDNAVNYRWGQSLAVEISSSPNEIVVESDGGRGMGAEEISTWLNWGDGDDHQPEDLSRYGQGGKAACGYLGRAVRIWAKKFDSSDVWYFEDENWAKRATPKDFGVPSPLREDQYPPTLKGLDPSRGHVRIQVSGLDPSRNRNVEVLRRAVASTYRCLLIDHQIVVKIQGNEVKPLAIPLATGDATVKIPTIRLGSRTVSGWAGRMRLQDVDAPIKSGLRLIHSGRLIRDGEWFGYNYQGKGSLNSLIGELHLTRFTPLPNKTDFVERGDEVWDELGERITALLQPLITELRAGSPETKVTKREKELAQEVADELGRVLASWNNPTAPGVDGSEEPDASNVGPGGRKRPQARHRRPAVINPRGPLESPPTPRTVPPDDPVGKLIRVLERITGGSTKPPLRVRPWDPAERSARGVDGKWLDINKNYPLYKSLGGAKAYIAETAILEICKPAEGEVLTASQYIDNTALLLLKWAQEAGAGSAQD